MRKKLNVIALAASLSLLSHSAQSAHMVADREVDISSSAKSCYKVIQRAPIVGSVISYAEQTWQNPSVVEWVIAIAF